MPGIHVRKTSWIDWTQKSESPTLTVPGSYWLCHKNNIYKFIFRYHRTIRNRKQFNYEKELMKVIRRVIKNQPPQGQQFGTSHLLVTFNRISWTRQDKIFALLKFKERSVVAFSHAFVLTINITHALEIEQNSKLLTSFSPDQPLILRNNNSNDEIDQYHNMQEHTLQSESTHIQLCNNMLNGNVKKLSINNKSIKQVTSKLDTSKEKSDINYLQGESIKHEISPKDNMESVKLSDNGKKLNEHNIEKGLDKCNDNLVSNNQKTLNDNSIVDINTDSVNLPYQYLIEEEIENAKQNIKKRRLEEVDKTDSENYTEVHLDTMKTQSSPCHKRKRCTLDNVQRSSDITDLVMEGLMFTIRQGQDAVAVIEQKTKLEVDEVLENSEKIETEEGEKCLRNSSLLGLENLITMIDLPETNKFGNKCQNVIDQESSLKNQSRSEELFYDTKHSITYNKTKEKDVTLKLKCMQYQTSSENSILPTTSFSYDNNSTIISKRNCSEVYDYKREDKNLQKNCTENKNSVYEKNDVEEEEKTETEVEEEVEEEDIIPEILQHKIFASSAIDKSKSKLKFILNKDLLMDDIGNEELINLERDKNSCFNKSLQPKTYLNTDSLNDNTTVHESKFNNTKKYKSNIPEIISNQNITLNEMPLPLQTMLIHKLAMKNNSLNNGNETSEKNTGIQKTEPCKKYNSSNIELKSQTVNLINVPTDIQYPTDPEKSVHNEKEICDEDNSSQTLKAELKDTETMEENVKLKEKESLKQSNYTPEVKKLPSKKIKDITKQFFKDLSYLEKEKNLVNQKYVTSRRKSLNIVNDASNDDTHIQMIKLFHDITRGAKVVVQRISVNKWS
ncbi:uncharacterized protein LOC143430211 [Xylocopa sonorina]|uniref:uncharacterized protein LOC143430211 n=1 Tax=Xylocopa sonorina TaxID=1818115 RepID=UPI00403B0A4E